MELSLKQKSLDVKDDECAVGILLTFPHSEAAKTSFLSFIRDLLKTMVTKCWSSEDAQCADSDLQKDECFTQMDRARILGADSECKKAFLATLGTTLHHPCMCNGVRNDDLLTCNMIHDVLHNRSHFCE